MRKLLLTCQMKQFYRSGSFRPFSLISMLLTVTAHHDTHSLDMNQLTRCSAVHLEHGEIYESFAVARTCRRGILQAGFGVIDVSFNAHQLEIAL